MLIPWLIGIDVGSVRDHTAMAIVQRHVVTWGASGRQEYQGRHLERFPLGLPYVTYCEHTREVHKPCAECPHGISQGGIIDRAKKRLLALPKPEGWELAEQRALLRDPQTIARPYYYLILDGTGVGRPVCNLFQALGGLPIIVLITAGSAVTHPERNVWHVAKTQLMSPLQVALQTRRFKVAKSLPEADILVREAMNFRYKLQVKATEYESWRENTHDDILFATALAVWYGEQTAPMFSTGEEPQRYAKGTGNVLIGRR